MWLTCRKNPDSLITSGLWTIISPTAGVHRTVQGFVKSLSHRPAPHDLWGLMTLQPPRDRTSLKPIISLKVVSKVISY